MGERLLFFHAYGSARGKLLISKAEDVGVHRSFRLDFVCLSTTLPDLSYPSTPSSLSAAFHISLPGRVHPAGYVILQYFPLCLTCYDDPETPYARVGGKNVENVLPYNTIMAKKPGQERELGPEDKWADTDVHYQKVKGSKDGKGLVEKNWNASMEHVQKV